MATISIAPGMDIQAAILAAPPASTFRLLPGIHRLQRITPRTGDTFEGTIQSGKLVSILSGAKILSTWTFDRDGWWAGNQTQQGQQVDGDVCRIGYPCCNRPEDLFMDSELKRHVPTRAEVQPGTWHFDYNADRIYVGDNPYGRLVETSVFPNLITAWPQASRVRFRHLIIEKYAAMTGTAALQLGNSRDGHGDWEVLRCELRWNHGAAVWNDALTRTRECSIHHNGGYGLTGAGWDILIEGNEISYNNTCGYNPYWGAGGSKWVWTTNMIVRGNYSHHNWGPGLWTDINNIGTLYEDNTVEDNQLAGIFHEISYAATIRRNRCRRNGWSQEYPGWVGGAGILVVSSPNVEVYQNVVEDNWQGICGLADHRGTGIHGPWDLTNLHVHDNRVRIGAAAIPNGRTGIIDTQGLGAFQPAAQNRFERNHYQGNPAEPRFIWANDGHTWDQWQAAGQDREGSMRP